MTTKPLGVTEARNQLGSLISRAVYAHEATRIARSESERAVIISEEDYETYNRLRYEDECRQVAERRTSGTAALDTIRYETVEDLCADLGLNLDGSERA